MPVVGIYFSVPTTLHPSDSDACQDFGQALMMRITERRLFRHSSHCWESKWSANVYPCLRSLWHSLYLHMYERPCLPKCRKSNCFQPSGYITAFLCNICCPSKMRPHKFPLQFINVAFSLQVWYLNAADSTTSSIWKTWSCATAPQPINTCFGSFAALLSIIWRAPLGMRKLTILQNPNWDWRLFSARIKSSKEAPNFLTPLPTKVFAECSFQSMNGIQHS